MVGVLFHIKLHGIDELHAFVWSLDFFRGELGL